MRTGGRLEGLAYAQGWPEVKKRLKDKGFEGEENEWLRRAALNLAIQHPIRGIASIGVFAYKGMGFMSDPNIAAFIGVDRMILIALNAVAVLCFLGLFLGAVVVGNQVLAAAFGLGAGLFLFTAMFTHALVRFNAPITPLVIISLLWLLTAGSRWAFGRRVGGDAHE